MPKRIPPKKPEYKRVGHPHTYVHVIEVVSDPEHCHDLEEVLEQLQQLACAEVVDEFTVEGNWETNCSILAGRRYKG